MTTESDIRRRGNVPSPEERPYDLVGKGATGFTGKLVAEHIARTAPSSLRWALAGRNKSKLESVRQYLIQETSNTSLETLPILIGDSSDQASVDKIVEKTRVVISTVGPFLQYGQPLVDACVRLQTDYVDSTGETPWVRDMIDIYHNEAAANGTLIVPSCGFDCIPSDLGAYLVAHQLGSQGQKAKQIKMSVVKAKGGVSGGTLHSAAGIASMPFSVLKKMNGLYYLADEEGTQKPEFTLCRFDPDFRRWQGFYFMEGVNIKYVYRTASLLKNAYGGNAFKYTETLSFGNPVLAVLATIGIMFVGLVLINPVTRWAAKKLVPAGTGPSVETMRNGMFRMEFIGEAEDQSKKAKATIHMNKDPGYSGTAVMVAESGLCLALDRKRLASQGSGGVAGFEPVKGGVVTAASAMGMVLIERLRNAGMTLEVKDL
ncbi:hypothetical protein HK102_008235 [Quaeritorhiza haematococci]|nr:hypothetical protein HK102_008235 [Quaeritorhiza haematococci]